MATTSGPFLDPEHATHAHDMPPLVVTTTGIPEREHVEAEHVAVPPTVEPTSHRTRWIALALVGVLAAAFAVIAYVFANPTPVPTAHMGLSDTAWSAYRAGERATGLLPVVRTADWQTYRAGERASSVTAGPGSVEWLSYRSGERQPPAIISRGSH